MDRRAAIAAHRFGLGARPGELAAAAADPRGWLRAQLDAPPPAPSGHATAATIAELGRKARRTGDPDERKDMMKAARQRMRDEVAARLVHRIATPASFHERWVAFWSDHFTVSVRQPRIVGVAVAYEREAIRPHATGRFADMLTAAVRHPAMLVYLDNQRSIGPDSRAGRRREDLGRDGGLNENLAREILELHTVGVDGGYDQADVVALAEVLTGWSVDRDGDGDDPTGFRFLDRAHQPGVKRVLGVAYGQGGIEEGEAALRDLARHPATARHVAGKLARHFVADDPDPASVDTLAAVFRDRDGDLRALAEAVIDLDAAWDRAGGKLRSPEDWVTAAGRALALDEVADQWTSRRDLGDKLVGALTALGQLPFSAPSPAGWPDRAGDWAGSEALLERIALAEQIGRRLQGVVRDPVARARDVLGPLLSEPTATALARAPDRASALALLLVSPELMRR